MDEKKIEAEVQRVAALPESEQLAEIVQRFEALPEDRRALILAELKANPSKVNAK